MPDSPKTLSPKDLASLIEQLDQVMAEATRLRHEVTQQIAEQREREQQKLSVSTRKTARR
jgi:hypothetical protein